MPKSPLSSGNALALILVLSIGSSSCLFQKAPKAFTPPPAQSRQAPAPAPAAAAPTLPAPPKIAGNLDTTGPPAIPASIPETPAPPASRTSPRRGQPVPAAPKTSTTTPPVDATTPSPAPATPRLGQIFTPDQLREHNRAIDESLDRVKKVLAALSKRNLNAEQSETVNRITTFQKQAEQAREAQDLANAELLAKRADLLAQDLLARVP